MKANASKKKVLLISFYFPPFFNPGSVRMGKFAKYLPEYGWEPRVLTVNRAADFSKTMLMEIDESYVFKTPYFILGDLFRGKSIINSAGDPTGKINQIEKEKIWNKVALNFVRTLHPIYNTSIINKLVWDPIGWYPYALKKGLEILSTEKIDVILSTYNPSLPHLIASKLHNQTEIPWVADFRDLWSHNPLFEKTQPFQFLEERLEKRIMRNCDFLTSVSKPLVKDLATFHSKNAAVIYNGFDEDDFKGTVYPTSKFTITYTGQIYTSALDPTPLFEALANLKQERIISSDNIEVRFFGIFQINNPTVLSKRYDLEDIIKTYGFIPFNESIKKQKESTILLMLGWNDYKFSGYLTSKIFEYMAAGRPILAITYDGSDLAQLIEESGSGIVANNANQIKEILTKWLGEFTQYKKIDSYIDRKPQVIAHYSRKEETKELANILNEVCLAPPHISNNNTSILL